MFAFSYMSVCEIQEKRTPKESPKQQNCKCCSLGLIQPVHGRLKQNSTFKHGFTCEFKSNYYYEHCI